MSDIRKITEDDINISVDSRFDPAVIKGSFHFQFSVPLFNATPELIKETEERVKAQTLKRLREMFREERKYT